MRRFAYWLFPLTAVGVAIFIVVFLIRINPSLPSSDDPDYTADDAGHIPSALEGSWISRFSVGEEKDYSYPINEVHMELGRAENTADTRYRISVPLRDSYELFCLKQELLNSGLHYYLHKEGEKMTLLIDSDERSRLESLVTKLKTYQITATVSPYTEE